MALRVGPLDLLASRLASRIARLDTARAVAPRRHPQAGTGASVGSASVSGPQSQPSPPHHDLVLYDFEGSPWCRLVREHATILDLTLEIRPCPRETLLYGEGAYGPDSRFLQEAMEWYQMKQKQKWRQQNQQWLSNNRRAEPRDSTNANDLERVGNAGLDMDDHLTFPVLVDRTLEGRPTRGNNDEDDDDDKDDDDNGIVVLTESYDILCHLWDRYGATVLPARSGHRRRPDQIVNSPAVPFAIRFLSLAGPSYLRPWPRCGLMRLATKPLALSPSLSTTSSLAAIAIEPGQAITNSASLSAKTTTKKKTTITRRSVRITRIITLYQSEGCPESRLVREALSSLEIPYRSVPVAEGSSNRFPPIGNANVHPNPNSNSNARQSQREEHADSMVQIPLLEVSVLAQPEEPQEDDETETTITLGAVGSSGSGVEYRVGARDCVDYLRDAFALGDDSDPSGTSRPNPTWFDPLPEPNLGRNGTGNSLGIGAYTAFVKGSRAFVPERALK